MPLPCKSNRNEQYGHFCNHHPESRICSLTIAMGRQLLNEQGQMSSTTVPTCDSYR
ncbi:hypothetical protein AVEN_10105-1, partial [Araneus ventricosus]